MIDQLKRSVNDLTFGKSSLLVIATLPILMLAGTLSIANASTTPRNRLIRDKSNQSPNSATFVEQSSGSSSNLHKQDTIMDYVKNRLSLESNAVQENYDSLSQRLNEITE